MQIMKSTEHIDPIFEQLFAKINPEIADSFTEEQLKAIKRGFGSDVWNRHTLDIRISVPIAGLRFYLIFLAGQERRSKQRLRYEKGVYPLLNPSNIVFLIGFLSIFLTCSITTFSFVLSSFTSLNSSFTSTYPTSIPWILNKSECENTRRTWRDDKCWDDEHSPKF